MGRDHGGGEAPASHGLAVFVGFLRRKLEDGGRQRLLHVGCRPPRTCAKVHPATSGSMMITWRSAASAAVTMARSVREAAARCERPGKTVSSAIRACGASARIRA